MTDADAVETIQPFETAEDAQKAQQQARAQLADAREELEEASAAHQQLQDDLEAATAEQLGEAEDAVALARLKVESAEARLEDVQFAKFFTRALDLREQLEDHADHSRLRRRRDETAEAVSGLVEELVAYNEAADEHRRRLNLHLRDGPEGDAYRPLDWSEVKPHVQVARVLAEIVDEALEQVRSRPGFRGHHYGQDQIRTAARGHSNL